MNQISNFKALKCEKSLNINKSILEETLFIIFNHPLALDHGQK